MAKGVYVQKDGGVRGSSKLRTFVIRLAALSRKAIVAYVIIAFAISFGFHILETHTDHQIESVIKNACLRGNVLRGQINQDRRIIVRDHHVSIRLISKVNCDKITKP